MNYFSPLGDLLFAQNHEKNKNIEQGIHCQYVKSIFNKFTSSRRLSQVPFANRKRILLFYLAKILETILVILSLLIIYNQLYHIAVTKVSNILFSNSIHNVFQTAFLGAIASRKGHSCSTNPTHANHSGRYSQNKKIVDKSIIHC